MSTENRGARREYMLLKLLTPKEWVCRIYNLQPELQRPIARIIWWDFFADRVIAERVSDFDAWIAPPAPGTYLNEPENVIKEGLIKVGYPARDAHRRTVAMRTKLYNAQHNHYQKN